VTAQRRSPSLSADARGAHPYLIANTTMEGELCDAKATQHAAEALGPRLHRSPITSKSGPYGRGGGVGRGLGVGVDLGPGVAVGVAVAVAVAVAVGVGVGVPPPPGKG
jgi:hypothetical protein